MSEASELINTSLLEVLDVVDELKAKAAADPTNPLADSLLQACGVIQHIVALSSRLLNGLVDVQEHMTRTAT